MSSAEPSPEPAAGTTPTVAEQRDSFSDVDSELGELVRELAAPPEGANVRGLVPGAMVAEQFVVIRRLGMGGMGVVYLARDSRLDRVVAVKLLAPKRGEGARRETGTARLEREAQAMALLSHPNVLTVHEVGRHDGDVYIAMEYVDGGTARQWASMRPRSVGEIVEVYLQAARGLAAAHAVGLVHRDFKPDNVLIGGEATEGEVGRVRVADFGLARSWNTGSGEQPIVHGPVVPSSTDERARPSIPALTATDVMVGTPGYMAPEQFTGGELEPASDQFAWGVALFEALWGERPYGTTPSWAASATSLRIPAGARRVPSWLRQVVLRAVELDPKRRFPSMQAVVETIEHGRGRARRRPFELAAAVAIAGAVALGIGLGSTARESPCSDAEPLAAAAWNAETRTAIDRASADDSALARQAWQLAAPMIDAWVVRWRTDRRESCVATRVHGSQSEQLLDRSIACFDEQLAELRTLLAALGDGPHARARAEVHAAALRDTADCRDATQLLARVDPPADPQTRAEVTAIADALQTMTFTLETRPDAENRAQLEQLAEDAQRTAYKPIEAMVELLRGRIEMFDHPEQAVITLRRAYTTARTAGDDDVATRAALLLAFLAGVRDGDRATAEIWLEHIAIDLARDRISPHHATALELTRSQVAQRAGAYEEAIASARAALASIDGPGGNPLHRLHARGELAAALDDAGHRREAIAEFDRLLADTEALYGRDHPRVAHVLTNRGLTHYNMRNGDAAAADQERALAIDRAHGESPEELTGVLLNLGLAHIISRRFDVAVPRLEEALSHARADGNEHDAALALAALGWLELQRERPAAALEHLRATLEIYRRTLPAGHPEFSITLVHIGDALLALGDTDGAMNHYLEAAAIWTPPEMQDHPDRAEALVGLARGELARGRREEALQHVTAVIELAMRVEVATDALLECRWIRARIHDANGERDRAIDDARIAAELARATPDDPRGDEIAAWLRAREPG